MSLPLPDATMYYVPDILYGYTECCGLGIIRPQNQVPLYPVCYNKGNKVIQRHHCGAVYKPERENKTPRTLRSIGRPIK